MKITKNEFNAYEGVRVYGKWNMFSPEARLASGLDKDTYISIMQNYSDLNHKFVTNKETGDYDVDI